MRIRVRHETTYTYDSPLTSLIQVLRLTPRSHDGQTVRYWNVDVNADAVLKAGEDAFGNITHMLNLTGPLTSVALVTEGEVDTTETHGIVTGTHERFPTRLYLRETLLTQPVSGLSIFAHDVGKGQDDLARLHAVLRAVNSEIAFTVGPTHAATSAAEAFVLQKGVCQDLAHIFITCARCLGIPARYVSGHLFRGDGDVQDAAHAWAEAYVSGLGWVGFDPANCICTTEAHVRVSVGLDYLGAAPVRGIRSGAVSEHLNVAVTVDQAQEQRQG
jgi:transglutaminase-like putative cysteine protease